MILTTRKLSTRMLQFLFGFLLALTFSILSIVVVDDAQAVIAPDELTAQGFTQFDRGNTTEALKLWRSASNLYHKTGNREGIVGSAINQSLALRSLGQFPQSCQVLAQEALQLPNANTLCFKQLRSASLSGMIDVSRIQPDSTQRLAVQHLGTALQLIGDLSNAKLALESIEKIAAPQRRGEIQLALGNVERAVFIQMRDRVSRSSDLETLGAGTIELKSQAEKVLTRYNQSAMVDSSKLKAQINQLSFLVDLSRWLATQQNNQLPEILELDRTVKDQLATLTPIVLQTNFVAAFSPIEQVYARLNAVNSLIEQAKMGKPLNPAADSLTTEALSTARSLANPRAISYSLGALGRLARQRNDLQTAQLQLREALSLAQSTQARDAAYQWQQDLAEIAKQQGNPTEALRYYQGAIDNLDRVRGDLLSISADVQLSFREQVEPVYRNYMALSLEQGETNLLPIIETYNRLRIAEIENFLQCGRLALVPLSQQAQSKDEAIFYILNLNQSVGVIVQSAPGSQRFYRADADAIQNALNGLAFNLQNVVQNDRVVLPDETTLKAYGQTLYEQLIAPAERNGLLAKKSRIAFVLDNTLQGMPVGLLYDGKTYLSQRYPLRLSIGSEIRSAEKQQSRKSKALIAALSEVNPNLRDRRIDQALPPLSQVESEVKSIRTSFPGSEILNKQFTLAHLEDQIQRDSYDIIHIATHGQFSSVPDETFVVAWDQLITAPQLSVLLKSRTTAEIDLLVLSACQTAKGDIRSTLGLAGIGVQSGARSTVASLWLVDDAATALFVQNFYKNLAEGESKATALQQAQVSLQNSPYSNPYFWGAFVLVGAA